MILSGHNTDIARANKERIYIGFCLSTYSSGAAHWWAFFSAIKRNNYKLPFLVS
jgi:hypothetical protein